VKTNNTPRHPGICTHNYGGSSKGIEGTGGATRLVKRLSADNVVYIGEYVNDDDAALQAALTHSLDGLIRVGSMTKEEWPRIKNLLWWRMV
jgi:hypothetical protein